MMISKLKYILPALVLLAVSCGGSENQKPDPVEEVPGPALVSTDPADGTDGLTGSSLSITFTYDQNILCTAEALGAIQADNGAIISEARPAGAKLTVTVGGLTRGSRYTVNIPAGTVKGYKQNQKASAAVSFHFSMKEPDPVVPESWETAASAVLHMGAGWNLGNTLDSNSGSVDNMWIEAYTNRSVSDYETAWGQPQATRALIHMFKEAGFNAIRVPVTWYPHMGTLSVSTYQDDKGDWHGRWDKAAWMESKDYSVDPAWMARVKEVVGYVIDEGMYCILNVHHDTGAESAAWLVASEQDFDAVKDRYQALWQQIATSFKDYGPRLLFESYNEMLDPYDSWCFASFASPDRYDAAVSASAYAGINRYADLFVRTVRATGGNNQERNLVVNTYGACSGSGTWNAHLTEPLSQFQLPEDPGHIALQIHSYWEADKFAQQKGEIDQMFSDLDKYLVRRLGVPVIIGEWGGGAKDDNDDNVRFCGYFSEKAKAAGMAALYWMGLSDGKDRAVPTWSMPKAKDAILKPYL